MYKHTLSIIASATLVASLGADTLHLDPIVVSASKAEQTLKNTTSNIDVITSEELEEKHITSVIDALRMLAHMPVAQSGGTGGQASFYQRGFKTENTVVMIDGIRYNDPTTIGGAAQLEHLMINDIEQIEIINGAQSGVWGANASAGVINIITKKAATALNVGVHAQYGSYETAKIGANVSQKIGDFTYYFGINRYKTENFSALTPKNENPESYESDAYSNQTFNTKLGYFIDPDNRINAQFTFIDADSEYDTSYPYNPDAKDRELHQLNRLGSIEYRHQLNQTDTIITTYSLSSFDKKDPSNIYSPAFKGSNKEFSLQGNFVYGNNSSLVSGLSKFDSKDILSAKELDSKGIFLTNTNQFNKLLLTESIRFDTYDEFNEKTTGKIGAKYFFNDDITVSANYGTAYRIPSLVELYGPYGANADLIPETTKGYDITVRFKPLTLTYFNNEIDNLIDYTTGYNNVSGETHFKGYEVKYQQNLNDFASLNFTYNRLFAKDKNGNYYAKRPHSTTQATLDLYGFDKIMMSTTLHYIGTRHEPDYNTYPYVNVQTGRYTLVSTLLNYALNESITLYAKGENLTDKRYQEVNGYGTAGRSVYLGLNAQF